MVKEDLRPTLVYCRESRDENSANYQRIEVQRDILLAFCERRGLTNIVDVIMDDDCTGTDFRRFDEVVRRVARKEIQVIVFKDASRLGRNLKESLIFRDFMAEQGAELLFESEEYNEDFFPLKAWFNEQRAKEDSLKIRRVLRHKMEMGELLVKPVYGYRRSGRCTMVPREETAKIVRWLYKEAAKGRGSGELAAQLNAMAIPTPSQAAGNLHPASCWNTQHIRRILTDPVYVGTMVHHKSARKSFKDPKTVRTPEQDWVIHQNHHAPLVSRELFEKVQALRRRFQRDRYTRMERPFSGLLRCGRCGSALVLRKRKDRPDVYICGKNHREGAIKDEIRPGYGCRPHRVREDLLYEAALGHVKDLLAHSHINVGELARRVGRSDGLNRKEALEGKLASVERDMDAVYEDKLRGIIPEGLFVRKCAELSDREAELRKQIQEYCEKIQKKPPKEQLTDLQMGDIINRLDAQGLTKEQLRLVFECVVVFEPGEIREEDRERLRLSRESYGRIQKEGGLVFLEQARRFDVP